MQRHREGEAQPLGDPAGLTAVRLQARIEERRLQGEAIDPAADDQIVRERMYRCPRSDEPAINSLVPRLFREAELPTALSHRVAGVIEALDGDPVVPSNSRLVGWYPELSGVEGHGGL